VNEIGSKQNTSSKSPGRVQQAFADEEKRRSVNDEERDDVWE
jgi:hypothetical protein